MHSQHQRSIPVAASSSIVDAWETGENVGAVIYNCEETDTHNSPANWGPEQKAFCSKSKHVSGSAEASFDCDAGLANAAVGWSKPKKECCCKNKHKGCVSAEGSFDCEAEFWNWQKGWT